MKRALITGITGQDGSYLTELLISKGYEVHGIIRRASLFNTDRIDHLYSDPHNGGAKMVLHYGDLADGTVLRRVIETVQPDEIYNLGAQSHVKVSFEAPEYTADVVASGMLRLLEAMRDYAERSGKQVRFYQAGSSEMFGAAKPPQSEDTAFYPRSPYAASKVAAHWYAVNYREAYNLFICNGILFNHESPRRGETFVTRKITRAVGRIKHGLQTKLYLGNMDSKRDWGFAGDYVEAMWLMLQQDKPDDYVVATGEAYSVKEFVERAFGKAGLDWQKYVEIDPRYFRPTEVDYLLGDPTKCKTALNWKPKTSFDELVTMMVEQDVDLAAREKTLIDAGFKANGGLPVMADGGMDKDARIFVAGARGLVGSAIVRALKKQGYKNVLAPFRKDLDLSDRAAVDAWYAKEKPEYVFVAAAKVGGIMANNTYPATFLYDNLIIQNNVIDGAHKAGVKKLEFLGSSCIYPKHAPQPMKEEHLLTGPLEPTNQPYAIAKIAGIEMVNSYRRQYGMSGISLMPTNLYGPGDNYDLQNSHVLPALIRKFHEAKESGAANVTVWGTGSPKREFLHADDLAEAAIYLMNTYDNSDIVNVGVGEDVSIKELAEIVKKVVGFQGELVFDTSKPDGTPRKLLDVSRLSKLGWKAKISLEDGIRSTYATYLETLKG